MFYIGICVFLVSYQLQIFKDTIPFEYVVDSVITIIAFTIITSVIDKKLKKTRKEKKAFIYCPECDDAKMRTNGLWICEKCNGKFRKPKID